MANILLSKDLKRILTISLTIGALILAFSVVGLGQELPEEEQTPSEQAKIGYRNVGSVMSSVSGAETDKSELVKEALSNLFDELAYHMEQKGLPDHVVEKFEDRANSLETMAAEGVLTSSQLGSEASNIVQSAGRNDSEGGVPVSVLKKAGLSEEDVGKLTGQGNNKEEATKAVRKMARKEDGEGAKIQSQDRTQTNDRAQNNTGNGNEGKPEEAGGPNNNKGEGNEATANENKGAAKGNNGNGSDKAGPSEQGEEEKLGNGNENNNSGNDSSIADDTTNDKGNTAGRGSDKAGPSGDEEVDKEGSSDKSAGNNGNQPENPRNKDKVEEDTDRGGNPGSGNPGNGKDKTEDEKEKGNGRGRRSNNGKGR